MSRRFIGIRWWLGAAFALVAAVSTAIVVSQFSSRSESEFRGHAEQLAAGSAVLAATQAAGPNGARRLPAIAQHFDLDLVLDGEDGRLLAKAPARTAFAHAPAQEAEALQSARGHVRRVLSTSDGGIVVIGIPLGNESLVALRPSGS